MSAGSGVAEVPLEEGIKRHLGQLTDRQLPGMAVLVARDGKVVWQGGFGWADLAKKTAVTPETKFRIGSVSKQFIAAAVLKLAEDGKLALTDPLDKFFPEFPGGRGINLLQLLNHTSGLHSYTEKPEFMARVAAPIKPGDLIAWFRDDKPDFAPGGGFHYNNSGYFLAGEVVARVSGLTLDAYLRQAFFEPLGMKHTGIYLNASPPQGMATGYAVAEGKAEVALDWDMSWAGGAGALYSTVGDLFLWNEALFGGKVLNPESFQRMTTATKLPPGVDGMNYGLGLMFSSVSRLPATGHGGGLNGWSSDLLRLPEQKCTIVALANALPPVESCEPAAVTRKIAEKLCEADIRKLPPLQEDPKVDKKAYPAYAGRYDYKSAVLTVTVGEDGRLMAQLTGQPQYEVFPSAPDAFFWKVTDAQVTFLRNEKGEVVAAQHHQGGQTFKAPRLTTAEIKLTDSELDAILGRYQYGPAVMTVTRDGDRVFAQLTGQPKLQIHPTSATAYEWREVKANVVFAKDKDGKVIKATHSQNGQTFDAPKIK